MKAPDEVRILAYAFIALGTLAVIEFARLLEQGILDVNVNLLMVPAGLGLLRLRTAWRTCALLLIVIHLLAVVTTVVLAYTIAPAFEVRIVGIALAPESIPVHALVALYAALSLLSLCWAFYILLRPDVAALFRKRRTEGSGRFR